MLERSFFNLFFSLIFFILKFYFCFFIKIPLNHSCSLALGVSLMRRSFWFNHVCIAGLASQFWKAGMLKWIKRYSFSVFTCKLWRFINLRVSLLLINHLMSALWGFATITRISKIVIFLNCWTHINVTLINAMAFFVSLLIYFVFQ